MQNILTNHEEHNQTLVVTPSNDKKHHAYAKDNPPSVAPQLQKTRITKTRAKRVSLTREQVVLSKMRLNVLNIYHPMTFNYKIGH
jgi:hypothetical protein